jgi:hypothetical protein
MLCISEVNGSIAEFSPQHEDAANRMSQFFSVTQMRKPSPEVEALFSECCAIAAEEKTQEDARK